MSVDKNRIKNIVVELVSKGTMFTAFDITKIVRKDIGFMRHGEVNSIVKELHRDGEMNGYLRENVDIGDSVQPFLYYHYNSDPSEYRKDWVENPPVVSSSIQISPQISSQVVRIASIQDENTIIPTKEGRVNVPKSLLKKIGGSQIDDTAIIYRESDSVVIQNADFVDSIRVRSYLNGNVYIPSEPTEELRYRFGCKKWFGKRASEISQVKIEINESEKKIVFIAD